MTIGLVAAPAAAGAASSALGLQDFMKVLLTQLTFQDPLKPMDNQAFMAQMAQFTGLEQTQRLNDRVLMSTCTISISARHHRLASWRKSSQAGWGLPWMPDSASFA